MNYWICTNCGIVHNKNKPDCSCGNSILNPFIQWVKFESKEDLERWINTMNTKMGAKLKLEEEKNEERND